MPLSALPPELQDVENHFADDDQYGTGWFGRLYRWYQKSTKTWFCFGYRCTEWWARWRKYPKILIALFGKGPVRLEGEDGLEYVDFGIRHCLFNLAPIIPVNLDLNGKWVSGYFSRVQYYTRWHVALQWPLIFSCHIYPRAEDVPEYGKPRPDSDGKLWFFYWGHFDNELIYWMLTSIYLGRNWK